MKENKNRFKAFSTLYIIGLIFVGSKLINYLKWTFQLVKNWELPEEEFFSKVNLVNSSVDITVTAYLIFAIAYIIAFGFIILGLYQLNQLTKLFDENLIFQEEVSTAFRKAGKSFLIFAFGTLITDIALLAWAWTSSMFLDLLSTELIVFIILGYLMFFLSEIFKEGITIREENELTI